MSVHPGSAPPDGRHARRERNRSAVIEAMFGLLEEGHHDAPVEVLAERSGVSVSSIFRYFDGLEDLAQTAIEVHFARHAPLFELTEPLEDTRRARVEAFVTSRARLHERTASVARVARSRALTNATVADALRVTRERFISQVRDHFSADFDQPRRADTDDKVAAIDALTSFESWELLTHTHGRSAKLVARAWTSALEAILDGGGS